MTDEATKISVAKRVSSTMYATTAGLPADVKLEGALLLVQALFMETVKANQRLKLFDSAMTKMRLEIERHLKTGKV